MFWLVILVAVVVFSLGYINSVNMYKNNILNLKRVKTYFDKIENGMSLNEVNSLLGKEGSTIKDGFLYKWSFGDTVMAQGYMKGKKSADIVSISEFFENYSKYFLRNGQAFIEIGLKNGVVSNKKAVGLF